MESQQIIPVSFLSNKFTYLNSPGGEEKKRFFICFFLSSLIIVPPNYIRFPKVIYSTSGGRRDYFSPHSADYSFIAVSGDGEQRGLVTEPEKAA